VLAAHGPLTLPLPDLRCQPLVARVLYPPGPGVEASWDAMLGTLTVALPCAPSACVLALLGSENLAAE
jgi:hypothetical protein